MLDMVLGRATDSTDERPRGHALPRLAASLPSNVPGGLAHGCISTPTTARGQQRIRGANRGPPPRRAGGEGPLAIGAEPPHAEPDPEVDRPGTRRATACRRGTPRRSPRVSCRRARSPRVRGADRPAPHRAPGPCARAPPARGTPSPGPAHASRWGCERLESAVCPPPILSFRESPPLDAGSRIPGTCCRAGAFLENRAPRFDGRIGRVGKGPRKGLSFPGTRAPRSGACQSRRNTP